MLVSAYLQNGHVDINASPFTTGDNITVWLQNVSPLPVETLTYEQMFMLRPAALFNQLCATSYRNNFIKTHCVNNRVGNGPRLIPTEITRRAVYIVRDPRDVALSMARYIDTDVANIVTSMTDPGYALASPSAMPHLLTSWSNHVQSWVQETHFPVHVIRYEDMCQNPVTEFMRFLEFCEMDVDQDLAMRSVEACALAKLQKQEREHGFREDRLSEADRLFFGKGGSHWRTDLQPELSRQIEADHGDVMRRFGYLYPTELQREA